jgi:hypothetical protein
MIVNRLNKNSGMMQRDESPLLKLGDAITEKDKGLVNQIISQGVDLNNPVRPPLVNSQSLGMGLCSPGVN